MIISSQIPSNLSLSNFSDFLSVAIGHENISLDLIAGLKCSCKYHVNLKFDYVTTTLDIAWSY